MVLLGLTVTTSTPTYQSQCEIDGLRGPSTIAIPFWFLNIFVFLSSMSNNNMYTSRWFAIFQGDTFHWNGVWFSSMNKTSQPNSANNSHLSKEIETSTQKHSWIVGTSLHKNTLRVSLHQGSSFCSFLWLVCSLLELKTYWYPTPKLWWSDDFVFGCTLKVGIDS